MFESDSETHRKRNYYFMDRVEVCKRKRESIICWRERERKWKEREKVGERVRKWERESVNVSE